MQAHEPVSLDEIRAARERIAGTVLRTPLVRCHADDAPAEIHLKLESLQPIGSFKLRGASNAMALADPADLARGVFTASAGNMAQGVAWGARARGIPCSVVVPDTAPQTKRAAVERLGGRIVPVPFAEWWQVFQTRTYPGLDGLFIHAFNDRNVMAGNGTIGLEILEDLPEVDTIVVPWGGGGLCCGIAAAVRVLAPKVKIFAAEVASAAPLAASLEAGQPTTVTFNPSFVDGISAAAVFPEMFALAQQLVDGSIVVSLDEVAAAVRLLAERNRVVVEGAGAAAVAAAMSGRAGGGTIACVVSGGNIDPAKLTTILSGQTP